MIQPVDLNLASRPFRNNTLPWVAAAGAVLFLLLFSVWNVTTFQKHVRLLGQERDKVNAIDLELADLQIRLQRARMEEGKYSVNTLDLQARKANEVIEWKAFSWTRLFNRLEQVMPWNVKMVSIRPLFRDRQRRGAEIASDPGQRVIPIAVEGQAKDLRALLDLTENLFDDHYFDRPEPDRYDTLDNGEIVFQMTFLYQPEATEPEPEPEGEEATGDDAEVDPAEAAAEIQEEVEEPEDNAEAQPAPPGEDPAAAAPSAKPRANPAQQPPVNRPTQRPRAGIRRGGDDQGSQVSPPPTDKTDKKPKKDDDS